MSIRRLTIVLLFLTLFTAPLTGQRPNELRFALRAEPKTFDPFEMASEEASETVRYLTSGVLIRMNRETQQLEPALAKRWKVVQGGKAIELALREDASFSDGSPFSARDVAYTMRRLLSPETRSAVADSFRSADGDVEIEIDDPHRIRLRFPARVANLAELFDEVTIVSANDPAHREAVLGPFVIEEYRPGVYLRLGRNPHYWKRDRQGRRLPYLDSIRLDIQSNEQMEALRFRRGQYHLIPSLSAERFERLQASTPAAVHDGGPSLDVDFLWFNLSPQAPIPAYKRAWFESKDFRLAISEAINRTDLLRIAFRGRATAAAAVTSPANLAWFNRRLRPVGSNAAKAAERLRQERFEKRDGVLRDASGRPVEFSLITNAGNRTRERVAAMIQQDLAQLGIRLNIVTLDFQSLIGRIVKSLDYEACLLGLVNVDLDPSAQMNIWLSSGAQHAWNPSQEQAATEWEAEIDVLMRAQAAAESRQERKRLFDRVQQIAAEQAPLVYLAHRNVLYAVSTRLRNVRPGTLWPQTFWNVDGIRFADEISEDRR